MRKIGFLLGFEPILSPHVIQIHTNGSIIFHLTSYSICQHLSLTDELKPFLVNFDSGNIGAYVVLGNHRTFVHFLHRVGARVLVVRQN